MRFKDKKVLVTGGARGIGAATALAFRREGATVAVGARTAESYRAFVERQGEEGFLPALGTLATRDDCFAVVQPAVAALGGLDVLVTSAGTFLEVPFEQVDQAHWDLTLQGNVAGTFFCIQAALPALEAGADGNVVTLGSDAGLVGFPLGSAYSASKGAVVNMTRALAVELARRIRCNSVCPGNVDTDMIEAAARASGDRAGYLAAAERRAPMRRMARPQEVAAAILFLASAEAGFITGAALPIDGGGVAGF